jgi:gas vesicle protein
MAEKNGEFGAFMSGFVIGGLVGAAVALLLAPQSGEETRQVIRDRSIELKDKATETAEEARARAEKAAAEARARADELSRQAREKSEELKQRGQVVLEEQRSRLEEAIEAGKTAATQKREELAETVAPETEEESPSEATGEA